MQDPFQFDTGRIPGWVYVLGAGIFVALYIYKEERGGGNLSGEHCRDRDGAFVPVPQCIKKRRKK